MIKLLKGIGYWILQYTWGIIMTLIGSLIALGLLITGHRPYRFHYSIYFLMKSVHGCGSSFGPFFILAEDCKNDLGMKQHEAGHGIQNMMFGPLNPFLVSIPSIIRFWLREIKDIKNKYIYSLSISFAIILIGFVITLLSIFLFQSLVGLAVSILIMGYGSALLTWLVEMETPLYSGGATSPPGYYDIWFEGQASKLGEKYFLE